jgi:hypothetical protein
MQTRLKREHLGTLLFLDRDQYDDFVNRKGLTLATPYKVTLEAGAARAFGQKARAWNSRPEGPTARGQ